MRKNDSSGTPELPRISLDAVILSSKDDVKKKVMVYPAEWLVNPELRRRIPKNCRYFMPHLTKPTEMTIEGYVSLIAPRVPMGQGDLKRWYEHVEKLEKRYSEGTVTFP